MKFLTALRRRKRAKEIRDKKLNYELAENAKGLPKNCAYKFCPKVGVWRERFKIWCEFHKEPQNRNRREDD